MAGGAADVAGEGLLMWRGTLLMLWGVLMGRGVAADVGRGGDAEVTGGGC